MNNFLSKPIGVSLILMILAIGACSQPREQIAPTPFNTSTLPSPTLQVSGAPTVEPTLEALQLAVQPAEKRTGSPELDPIIDAVLAHDMAGLRELTEFTIIGCTHEMGLGGPPKCPSGEEEGTPVEVIPFLGVEGHHLNREEFNAWEGPDVLGLLAAYKVSDEVYSSEEYPRGDFALVFLEAHDITTLTLQVRQGWVIRYDYSFNVTLQADIEAKSSEILIPLTFKPIPTSVPWKKFIDPIDRFEFVYPPTLDLLTESEGDAWKLGDQIQIEILGPTRSWITCFDQGLGDCPFVESDQMVQIGEQDVRRVKGYIGSVGGNIPQEFLVYIFELGDKALVFTLYALPFDADLTEVSMIWPLDGMELDLFERTVQTVIIHP